MLLCKVRQRREKQYAQRVKREKQQLELEQQSQHQQSMHGLETFMGGTHRSITAATATASTVGSISVTAAAGRGLYRAEAYEATTASPGLNSERESLIRVCTKSVDFNKVHLKHPFDNIISTLSLRCV
jgi:hypothetical protein